MSLFSTCLYFFKIMMLLVLHPHFSSYIEILIIYCRHKLPHKPCLIKTWMSLPRIIHESFQLGIYFIFSSKWFLIFPSIMCIGIQRTGCGKFNTYVDFEQRTAFRLCFGRLTDYFLFVVVLFVSVWFSWNKSCQFDFVVWM